MVVTMLQCSKWRVLLDSMFDMADEQTLTAVSRIRLLLNLGTYRQRRKRKRVPTRAQVVPFLILARRMNMHAYLIAYRGESLPLPVDLYDKKCDAEGRHSTAEADSRVQ